MKEDVTRIQRVKIMTAFKQFFVHDSLTTTSNKKNMYPSEANASELLENLQ